MKVYKSSFYKRIFLTLRGDKRKTIIDTIMLLIENVSGE